ncbi:MULTISPECIES: DUF4179 domain-containing protein [unclassified Sporosarcina]|uniref:DUF4179 domain-containing protein n=1 Tax=unclassified Sporosarcina TaxID=2647733 RepID=UPI00203A9700|nr:MULTISPECIES: DUF4179 domain-containing protein [unclassified Sporosarcina]GKV64030.1 hypothetical protein NCCP2331_01830 [Sporosarcina sp. NCCP-2331]GLB56396.1 hypothetical protein NCCP2378_21830 [Sporosarcina sp. NCCP-2378]
MYEKEEEKLKKLKEQLDSRPLPLTEADQAIREGMERAKRETRQVRKRRKRFYGTVAVVALLLLTFVTSIRVSPAFANAVASIPGMEKFVELISMDKGLDAAFQNDYYQQIGASQTIGDLTLTIDGVILDESGMNVFYTIDSEQLLERIRIETVDLEMEGGMPEGSVSYGSPQEEDEKDRKYTDRIDFHFVDPYLSQNLSFDLKVEALVSGEGTAFSVPFTVPEKIKSSEVYTLNQEVEIDSQKFTVETVTISPLRVGVKIVLDPSNRMKILNFEDMRLEDEKGEVWSSIKNGTTAFGEVDDSRRTYFLQSNYFNQPKKLYLRMNKVQAVRQEDAVAEINTETGEWLNQPADQKIELVESDKYHVELRMPSEGENGVHYDLFSSITDSAGKEVNKTSTGMYTIDGFDHWNISFSPTDHQNPLKLELSAYPNYLEGDVKLELK